MGTFNHQAAVTYAQQHVTSYNSAYHSYDGNGQGGDCTNYVSQCMLAGGWTMTGGNDVFNRHDTNNWWYNSQAFLGVVQFKASYAWAAAYHFCVFATTSGRARIVASKVLLRRGDVVQYKDAAGAIFHTFIVIDKRRSDDDLLLASHSGVNPTDWLSAVRARNDSKGNVPVFLQMQPTFP